MCKLQTAIAGKYYQKSDSPPYCRPTMSVYSDQGYSRARPIVFTRKRRSPVQDHPKFVVS